MLCPGVFLLEQERYPEAANQLAEAVALEPDDYDLTVTAATALRQAGESSSAEDMYRKAAAIRPQVRLKTRREFFSGPYSILRLISIRDARHHSGFFHRSIRVFLY